MVFLSDPQLSPAGDAIAFVRTEADSETDTNRRSLWCVRLDSEQPVRLSDGPDVMCPRWTSDARSVTFVAPAGPDGTLALWQAPADRTAPPAKIRTLPPGVGSPAISPDGRRVAFVSAAGGTRAPTAPIALTRLGFKADGLGLVPDGGRHLFVLDLDSGATTDLTPGDIDAGPAAWSADGQALFAAVAESPNRDVTDAWRLVRIDADTGRRQPLTAPSHLMGQPVVSPDGKLVAYIGHVGTPNGHDRLFVVPCDGATTETPLDTLDRNVLTGAGNYPGGPPRWTGDDELMVCLRDGGCSNVYSLDLRTNAVTKVLGDAGTTVLSFDASGSALVCVLADAQSPSELWVATADGRDVRRLPAATGDRLRDLSLPQFQRREFTAPDGVRCEGWIAGPPDDAGLPAPLLLDVHGGPHNAWAPVFTGQHLWHAVLVSRGWRVLLLNPRGSDGYGERHFRGLEPSGWGTADQPDFVSALEALIADGTADRNRLAITGFSYGGFTTNRLTATTDLFRAAVSGGCISDLASFTLTCDAGPGTAGALVGGLPWTDPERLSRSSPITHVTGTSTPTLLLHGAADERCPPAQAEQWFAALRHRGVPSELVLYPGANHGLLATGRPSHRADYARRLVDWLERWVTGPQPPWDDSRP